MNRYILEDGKKLIKMNTIELYEKEYCYFANEENFSEIYIMELRENHLYEVEDKQLLKEIVLTISSLLRD